MRWEVDENFGSPHLVSCTSEFPGSHGDSCAETARYVVLSGDFHPLADRETIYLPMFRTNQGYVRHPKLKDIWGESDFSSDQAVPLLMGFIIRHPHTFATEMSRKCKWRIPQAHISTPGLMALCRGWYSLYGLMLVVQAMLLRLPFRWSDSKKRFESTKDSAADYLNFIVGLWFMWSWLDIQWPAKAAKFIMPDKPAIMDKVDMYYAPELETGRDIANLYAAVLTEMEF